MAQPKVTEKEVRFARAFIAALGANALNGYLLLAVIAWMRAESGQNYLGNNPFNIRNSPFAIGYRQTKSNGRFAIFKDLAAAAKATAYFLTHNKGYGYEKVVLAARRHAADDKSRATQAIDFLNYIAASKWSSDHYGTGIYVMDGPKGQETKKLIGFDFSKNRIVKIWMGLTGTSLPPEWFQDPTKPPPPKPPPPPPFRQPRALTHVLPKTDYLAPYGSRIFYEDRKHMGDYVMDRVLP